MILRILLSYNIWEFTDQAATIFPDKSVAIIENIPPQPPQVVQILPPIEKFKTYLDNQIAFSKLNVSEKDNQINIGINELSMFESGQAQVNQDSKPLLEKIAKFMEDNPGKITRNRSHG